jgi:23S rRNA (adenine-N6)-dimethyltransferase
LSSAALAERLVELIKANPTDTVLEIGAGTGKLTRALAAKVTKVIAIEKDPQLANVLQTKFAHQPHVNIVNQDFLEYKLPNRPGYKVVGNIPFAITADILRKLLNSVSTTNIYLIMQLEAAERLAGVQIEDNSENLFSLQFQPWFRTTILYKFSPQDFKPAPKVNAVLIHISKRDPPLLSLELRSLYLDFICFCFTHNQHAIKSILIKLFTRNQVRILEQNGINTKLLPSQLKLDSWLLLFNTFNQYVNLKHRLLVSGCYHRLQTQQSKLQKINRTR